MEKKRLPDLLVPLYVLVLLVGVLVTKGYELLTFRGVTIAVALTACVLLILVGLVLAFEGKQHRDEFQLLLNRMQQLIPPSDFPWLYNDADFAKAESTCSGDSVWIISPDLANVTGNQVIIDAVKKNIERGIVYTYIVSNSAKINLILPGLQQLFRSTPGQLKLIKLPVNQFRLLSVTHIAVFNASMTSGMSPEVYLELPVEEAGGKKTRGYWIKVAKSAAGDLAGRFRKIAEGD
jgi:hypothetical protein